MQKIERRGSWSETGNDTFKRCPECGKIAPLGLCQASGCESALSVAKMLLIASAGDNITPLIRQNCPDGFRFDGRFLEYYCNDSAGSTHMHRMAI
jgi:hypothetical protein